MTNWRGSARPCRTHRACARSYASWLSEPLAQAGCAEGGGADALVLGLEGGGERRVVDDEQVLVVLSVGRGRVVERAEHADAAIDHHNLVVHIPGIAVLQHVQPDLLEAAVLREGRPA